MTFNVVFPVATAMALGLSAQTPATAPKPRTATPKSAATAGAAAGTAKPATQPPASPAATPAAAADTATSPENKVVMTVGDTKITAKEFDTLIESLPEQARAQARGPMKRQVADQIATVKLLAAEARKRGLDNDQAVQARIQFSADNLLAGAAYNNMLQNVKVDDASLQKYYDEHKNEFETVQARHILIRFKGSPVPNKEGKPELTEEQALAKAQEIRKQLVAGSDFAALAKAESDDTGSGANGGELGTFGRGQMVPAFEEIAFKQPANQVSEPVKTQFGYHLIQVEKHESKPFDSVKSDLEGKMKPQAARESVENLRKNAKIVLDESFFGPATPAAPAGVGAAALGNRSTQPAQ